MGNSGGIVVTDNCYAYAMYCSPEELKDIHDKAGEVCDYGEMRGEVSDTLFNGVSDFSYSSLLVESSNSVSSSFGCFGDGAGSDGGSSDSGGGGGD